MASPIQIRKQLLVAESEINRALITKDYHAVVEEVRHFSQPFRNIGAWASSSTAVNFLLGLRPRPTPAPSSASAKPSWITTGMDLVQLVAPIWTRLRGNKKSEPAREPAV